MVPPASSRPFLAPGAAASTDSAWLAASVASPAPWPPRPAWLLPSGPHLRFPGPRRLLGPLRCRPVLSSPAFKHECCVGGGLHACKEVVE